MGQVRWRRRVGGGAVLLLAAVAVGCSSGDGGGTAASSTTRRATTTTTAPARWTGAVGTAQAVDGNYRQGIAEVDDGWVFTTKNALYRTDEAFHEAASFHSAIPAALASKGYDHMGDPDVADGKIWVPLERADKARAEQVIARFDVTTLEFVDAFEVPQHHASFVTVDDDGTVWSSDQFSDDALTRYRLRGDRLVPLRPLRLSQTVDKIQGGDVVDGAVWLSTDDATNGVYRVDPATGRVDGIGSAGHVDGEGEGIDAGLDADGFVLSVLVADEAIVPMWVVPIRPSSE